MIKNSPYNKIKEKISQHKSFDTHSVLIPLFLAEDGDYHLVFQKRSQNIRQPGDISFPGGKIEAGESSYEAAIRETSEELNLPLKEIEIITQLPNIFRVNGLNLSVFLGALNIKTLEALKDFNTDEIETIFSAPLSYFMSRKPDIFYMNHTFEFPANFPYERIENGKNYKWHSQKTPVYFYDYEGYTIWGMTAEMIVNLVALLKA